METYYTCTWLSFINQKKIKNEKLKYVNKNYTVHKLLKITGLYIVYLFTEYADN